MDGFLFVDKPWGPSSFDVVRTIRRAVGCAKAGHSGTLDPQASGLLIVALGAATRLLPYLPKEPKRYSFGMQFGKQTDTLDGEGTVLADNGRIPTPEEVAAVLPGFVGELLQTPPKFSAVKVDGRRAYALARRNEDFELAEKPVRIFSIELVRYDIAGGLAECTMACSHGTYVRALVRDIAQRLRTVAFASYIRRNAIGPFSVDDAVEYDGIASGVEQRIVPVRTALVSMPSVTLTEDKLQPLVNGRDIALENATGTGETTIAYTEGGDVAAVLIKKENGFYHPIKVFVK